MSLNSSPPVETNNPTTSPLAYFVPNITADSDNLLLRASVGAKIIDQVLEQQGEDRAYFSLLESKIINAPVQVNRRFTITYVRTGLIESLNSVSFGGSAQVNVPVMSDNLMTMGIQFKVGQATMSQGVVPSAAVDGAPFSFAFRVRYTPAAGSPVTDALYPPEAGAPATSVSALSESFMIVSDAFYVSKITDQVAKRGAQAMNLTRYVAYPGLAAIRAATYTVVASNVSNYGRDYIIGRFASQTPRVHEQLGRAMGQGVNLPAHRMTMSDGVYSNAAYGAVSAVVADTPNTIAVAGTPYPNLATQTLNVPVREDMHVTSGPQAPSVAQPPTTFYSPIYLVDSTINIPLYSVALNSKYVALRIAAANELIVPAPGLKFIRNIGLFHAGNYAVALDAAAAQHVFINEPIGTYTVTEDNVFVPESTLIPPMIEQATAVHTCVQGLPRMRPAIRAATKSMLIKTPFSFTISVSTNGSTVTSSMGTAKWAVDSVQYRVIVPGMNDDPSHPAYPDTWYMGDYITHQPITERSYSIQPRTISMPSSATTVERGIPLSCMTGPLYSDATKAYLPLAALQNEAFRSGYLAQTVKNTGQMHVSYEILSNCFISTSGTSLTVGLSPFLNTMVSVLESPDSNRSSFPWRYNFYTLKFGVMDMTDGGDTSINASRYPSININTTMVPSVRAALTALGKTSVLVTGSLIQLNLYLSTTSGSTTAFG